MIVQLQSLVDMITGPRFRVSIDVLNLDSSSPFSRRGFLPYPARRWYTLWLPSPSLPPSAYVSLSNLARSAVAAGLFVAPSGPLHGWLAAFGPAIVWRVDILGVPSVPPLVAVFFDFSLELSSRAPKVRWFTSIPPISPIQWFDAVPFPSGSLPPFPLVRETVLPLGPPPPPAVLPASVASGSGRSSPSWLLPALPPSSVPFPPHDPMSPLFPAFSRLLASPSSLSPDVQSLFLRSLEFGFGHVAPSGVDSHRSEPPNSRIAREHPDLIRDKFLQLASPPAGSLPLAYGPFSAPPFPRLLPDGSIGPQPIGAALSIHFKGSKWGSLHSFTSPSDRLVPGYADCVGLGKPRLIQDASAPHLPAFPTPPALSSSKGHGWSLNQRLHFPKLLLHHSSVRTVAELLSFFGAGTVLLQTDFPAAYKNCRLSTSSLFAHVSYTETSEHGKEYWVDAAEIFGSGDAPGEFDLFVVPFEHLLRRHDPLLSLIIHYVDNLFVFLPPFLLGDDPSATASRAAASLFSFFDSLPQAHHDDSWSMPGPALGFVWSTLPFPSVAFKPARAPLVRALLAFLSSSSLITCDLAIAARGLFSWVAQIMATFSPFLAPLLELERAAVAARGSSRGRRRAGVRVPLPGRVRVAAGVLLNRLFPSSPPALSSPSLPIRLSPLLLPSSPIACVLRADASPHFGCGGYSVTARLAFHAPWDHPPHSSSADLISSTLAEALAALISVRLFVVPGLNVFQTDSDDLFFLLSKRYSTDHVLNHIIMAIFAHCVDVGASLIPHHILRGFNRVSDALASNKPSALVSRLLADELGIPLHEASLALVSCPSSSSLLSSVRSSLLTWTPVPP